VSSCSIILPVFDGAGLTARCLALLTDPWPEPALEVVVVDDGSSDATAEVLSRLASRIPRLVVIRRPSNGGFAAACNEGARASRGRFLVFLNNDTEPTPGWLDELVDYALHRRAAVVGAKLLYPDMTVQHAGLVFDREGNPRHVYSGFPSEHPAVNRSGPVQAVTGAAMLVRRDTFDALGGFDPSYRNGHEDVDFCLRVREAGGEVYYAHRSVLLHLESATRGRRTKEAAANGQRFRRQWSEGVRPDDLERYQADGLVRLEYDHDGYLAVTVDPLLGTAALAGDEIVRRALHDRSNQVADLLRQVIALTVSETQRSLSAEFAVDVSNWPALEPCGSVDDDDALIAALGSVRSLLGARAGSVLVGGDCGASYRQQVRRFRSAVNGCTPRGSHIAVVSRGDPALLDFYERRGCHFPADGDGNWLGYHPAGSEEALDLLHRSLEKGVTHLALPASSMWWLDAYADLAATLKARWDRVPTAGDCSIFAVAS
jgi:GT2 family glycosyltransferase